MNPDILIKMNFNRSSSLFLNCVPVVVDVILRGALVDLLLVQRVVWVNALKLFLLEFKI